MLLAQKRRSKGITLTISAVLEGLFFIGIVALGYWFILSRILDIHVTTLSSDNERHAINLANVLLSYENLAYVKDGKIQRGVLEAEKLDNFASKKGSTYDFNKTEFISGMLENYKEIEFGYPNSFNVVTVVDLDSCKPDEGCTTWVTTLVGPTSVEGLSVNDFIRCLKENFKNDPQDWARRAGGCGAGAVTGGGIGFLVGGPLGAAIGGAIGCGIGFLATLWDWGDVNKCGINSMPESLKYFFASGKFAAAQGLPTLIRYPDGSMHAGRIIVSVVEWR
jgi:hypothetical protein